MYTCIYIYIYIYNDYYRYVGSKAVQPGRERRPPQRHIYIYIYREREIDIYIYIYICIYIYI